MPRARVAASNDLNRMPMNGGANPAPAAAVTRLAARTASASSTVVAAVAVAVLEVDAQVLDGLALELLAHARRDGRRRCARRGRRRPRAPRAARRVDGGERVAAPHGGQLGREPVGRARRRCARAGATRRRPGYAVASSRVGRGEPGVDRGEVGGGEWRCARSLQQLVGGQGEEVDVTRRPGRARRTGCAAGSVYAANRSGAVSSRSCSTSSSSTARTSSGVIVRPVSASTTRCWSCCQTCEREISAVAASSMRLCMRDRAVAARARRRCTARRRRGWCAGPPR